MQNTVSLHKDAMSGCKGAYILSNKRNAPNIKLNHRFIFTMKDWMSVYVRYEYDKMFESTTKKYDH